ncbi:MAG TPA: glycosyltransferase family 87 protein [Rhizomicrobium sp.]|nr:glycosyltransferase family 87 protein [Rhizomicrobium sp.]
MAKASNISPWALVVAGGVSFAYLAELAWLALTHRWLTDSSGHPLAADFLSFWSAGLLAWGGHAVQAYDWSIMHALQQRLMHHAAGGFLGWAYPPLFFTAAMPLALLPFAAAFLGWVGVSFALYAASVAHIARDARAALLAVAAPASLACAVAGQNGFLTAALMAGVLLQLEARPILAGLLLGLLTYKPHFGLLFPVALLFGGYGRVFVSAVIATLAILLASWLAAPDSLAAFAQHLGGMSSNFLSQGHAGFYKLQSLYGLLRMSGIADGASFAAQGALLVAMAGFIAWLWRNEKDISLRCAGLCAATLLATPYLFLYDFPVLSVAIAFLWRGRPFDRIETILLLLSQFATAAFVIVSMPTGFIAALLTLLVIARRAFGSSFRTAPLAQLA